MWIFTRYGFFSIACRSTPDHQVDPAMLMIRARSRAHLENLSKRFPQLSGPKIKESTTRDYRFRLIVQKDIWIDVMAELAREQTWSHFRKQAATFGATGEDYVHCLPEVWALMKRLQEGQTPLNIPSLPSPETAAVDHPAVWDGITLVESLTKKEARLRLNLAEAARRYQWTKVLTILSSRPDLVNTTKPGGRSLYTPLHQAAHEGSEVPVVESLLQAGAFRTVKNAKGECPADIAAKRQHAHLSEILRPSLEQFVPPATLTHMQEHFHKLIIERAAYGVRENRLRLPELEPLLEFPMKKLIARSWSRIAGGSGQLHEITAQGYTLVEAAFV